MHRLDLAESLWCASRCGCCATMSDRRRGEWGKRGTRRQHPCEPSCSSGEGRGAGVETQPTGSRRLLRCDGEPGAPNPVRGVRGNARYAPAAWGCCNGDATEQPRHRGVVPRPAAGRSCADVSQRPGPGDGCVAPSPPPHPRPWVPWSQGDTRTGRDATPWPTRLRTDDVVEPSSARAARPSSRRSGVDATPAEPRVRGRWAKRECRPSQKRNERHGPGFPRGPPVATPAYPRRRESIFMRPRSP
jgi:hypothetical protein